MKRLFMKRLKDFEFLCIFKESFYVQAYLCGAKDGRKFVVMAHNFEDMETFMSKVRCKVGFSNMETRWVHEDTPMEEQEEWHSYIADKKGNPKKYPFWYRGRIYELKENKPKD